MKFRLHCLQFDVKRQLRNPEALYSFLPLLMDPADSWRSGREPTWPQSLSLDLNTFNSFNDMFTLDWAVATLRIATVSL